MKCLAILAASLVCSVSCGNDDKNDDGSLPVGAGGSHAGPSGACLSFCEVEQEKGCGLYSSLADCYGNECTFPADASSDCLDAIEVFYQCTQVAIEVCNGAACDMETEALGEACN